MSHNDVVTNIIVGATAGQGNAQIATNAIAPYASMLIGDTFDHTDDPNKAAQLLSHAVLGAIIAYMNGGDPVAGAASASASELASLALAKELYPEAFDENGNLVRSRLSEEQAESIVAISNAIGALAGGITGGDSYDASIGSFIGENAVENNWLSPEQLEEKEKEWQLADTWYEKQWVEISWMPADAKGDYVRLGGHLVNIYDGTIGAMPQVYDGLSDTLPQMWENSPTEAKAVLVTAGGIVVLPFVYVAADYGITYAYMNPEKVLLGYEAVDVGIGMFDGNPPTNFWQSVGKGASETYLYIKNGNNNEE